MQQTFASIVRKLQKLLSPTCSASLWALEPRPARKGASSLLGGRGALETSHKVRSGLRLPLGFGKNHLLGVMGATLPKSRVVGP